ncbi:MAG: PIG-L deacetylase family protein, partial [Deinococcus sp.]
AWDALEPGERPGLWYYASPQPPEQDDLKALYLPPTLRRDVSRFVTRKLRAIACHRSQALSTVDFIRRFPERVTEETFHVVGSDAVGEMGRG